MSILQMNTQEKINLFEKEKGIKLTNMFDLDYFVFMKMMEEIENEL